MTAVEDKPGGHSPPEPDEGALYAAPDYVLWRFFVGQSWPKAKHALNPGGGDFRAAVCGNAPPWHDAQGWRGLASAEDRMRLARLPKCGRCLRILGPRADGVPW